MKARYKIGSVALAQSLLAAPVIIHNEVYANNLNAIIPDLYAALDVVSRELVGFIPAVSRNFTMERAALGEVVKWEVAQTQEAYDIAPAMQIPEPPDHVAVTRDLVLTKARAVPFGYTGEDQRGVMNGQIGYLSHQAGIFAQALRKLVNEIELDVAREAAANASRATGTAGTTPFATGVGDAAQVRKILDDNGAPPTGRALIVDTSAGALYRTNAQLTKVNESGTEMTLRDGELANLSGISIHESAQVVDFVSGAATGMAANAAGYAVGATSITVTGTGTIKAGDVITFAGDANKYVVAAERVGAGVLTISAPGLRRAIPAVATNITVGASYKANVAFSPDALVMAIRPPAIPQEGDARIDSTTITDIRSGMTFEVSIWPGYRKVRFEVAAVWGQKAVKREHIALLLG